MEQQKEEFSRKGKLIWKSGGMPLIKGKLESFDITHLIRKLSTLHRKHSLSIIRMFQL